MTLDQVLDALHDRGCDPRRSGTCWSARCPAHDDHSPSLSVSDGDDGRVLLRCHAGCTIGAVIAALGMSVADLFAKRPCSDACWRPERPHTRHASVQNPTTAQMLPGQLWRLAAPANGSVVEMYLRNRGITINVPPVLRCLGSLRHAPTNTHWPCMVARVDIEGPDGTKAVAIHRTYLRPDGSGKAPVTPAKMALGRVGGAGVRLADAAPRMAIAEGIETALSVMQETGLPTWAALSAGGIERLLLPPLPLAAEIVIAADHDRVGLRAAERAGDRWTRCGRRLRIAAPPKYGTDFNDLLAGVWHG